MKNLNSAVERLKSGGKVFPFKCFLSRKAAMKASKLLINLEQRKISFRKLYNEEDPRGKLQALPHDYRRSMQSEDNSKHCISPKTSHLTQMYI